MNYNFGPKSKIFLRKNKNVNVTMNWTFLLLIKWKYQ